VTRVVSVIAPVEILANDLGGDDVDDLVGLIIHGELTAVPQLGNANIRATALAQFAPVNSNGARTVPAFAACQRKIGLTS
jgi:hypothetical protein